MLIPNWVEKINQEFIYSKKIGLENWKAMHTIKNLRFQSNSSCHFIDRYAFYGSNLRKVYLPNSLWIIFYKAFDVMSNLKRINFPASLTLINKDRRTSTTVHFKEVSSGPVFSFEENFQLDEIYIENPDADAFMLNGATKYHSDYWGIASCTYYINKSRWVWDSLPICSSTGHVYVPRASYDAYNKIVNDYAMLAWGRSDNYYSRAYGGKLVAYDY